ncbi:hypothetical protein O0L34_g3476 [Tuta absoluta]|nr:hypothetical protein O0L34_g3476 [Tuta absoluta]
MKLIAVLVFGLVEVVFSIPVVSNEEYNNPLQEKENKYLVSLVKKRQTAGESYSDIIVFPDSTDNEGNTILSKTDNQRRPIPRPDQNIGESRPQQIGGSDGNGPARQIGSSGNGRIPIFEEPEGGFIMYNGSPRRPLGGNKGGLNHNRRPLEEQLGGGFDVNGRPTSAGFGSTGRQPIREIPNGQLSSNRRPLEGQFDGIGRQEQSGSNVNERYPQGSNTSGSPGGRIPQNGGSDTPVITSYAAFSGDSCASGLLKFGEQCIYIDK